MKTLKKALCLMLSIIMAFSCLSVAANAEGEETFSSSLKYYSTKDNTYNAKVTLDMIDEILKDADICEEVVLSEKLDLKITIDLRSVNALCGTIDDYVGILKFATVLGALVLGDLKDLELGTWQKGLERTEDDITILIEFIELLNANRSLVAGICDASLDLGVFKNYIDLKEIFGEDGVSGLIKEALIGFVYEKDTPEFENAYNKYKDDVDAFIYGDLMTKLTKDALPGFTVNDKSTIADLLCSAYNISFDKYIKPALESINLNLAETEVPELKKLNGIVNLDGKSYDLTDLYLDPDKDIADQINDLFGKYLKQIVPSYNGWENGAYENLSSNLENTLKYVATESQIIADADKKTLEEIGIEVAEIILRNADFGEYEVGLEGCETLEEMVSALLINTAKEMKIGVNYDGDENYLVVIGDMLAAWAYDNFNVTDLNGKAYLPGGGKDVFEVANYELNYFLFDRKGAAALELDTTKSESFFTKVDKLADYFGETKKKGVSFNSKNFFLGSDAETGLLDKIFALDVAGILDMILIPILENAGDVVAIEFLYKSVQYFLNNWAEEPDPKKGEKPLFPAYQKKAFTNALSNKSIANMVALLLKTVEARKNDMVTVLTFALALMEKGEDQTYTISDVTVSDCTATGKDVAPAVTLKADGKVLKQGTDFIAVADSKAPGTTKVTIKGIGMYKGTIERECKINMDKITSLSYTSKTTSVTLKWNSVAYADKYNVYMVKNGAYTLLDTINAPSTSRTVSGLSAGKDYKFKVEAVSDSYGATEAKEITAYTLPGAVTNLKATPTASTVALSWSKVTGATHYKVEYSTGSNKWKTIDTVTSTKRTVSGLSSYTSYSFRVTAMRKLANGSYLAGSPTTVKVKTTLGTPSKLSATYTSSTATLTWSKVTGATAYQVLRYTGGKWVTLATVTKGTSYKVSKLKAGTKYVFAVRAGVKENGKWVYGSRKELTQYTGIVKPSKISVSSTTATSAKITWSKVSGAKSYEVFMYSGGKWISKGKTKNTSMTVSKLPSGTKIKFKVRAITTLGGKTVYGDYSSEVTALTLVGKVSGLKTTLRKTNSISLSWKKVTGATGYEVYRYSGKKWIKLGTTSKTSFTDSKSLKKGTQYQYKVRAVQKISKKTTRYGAYSSVLKAKTTIFGSARY